MNIGFLIAGMDAFGGTERATTSVANGLVGTHGIDQVHLVALMGSVDCRFDIDPRIRRTAFFSASGSMVRRFPAAVTRLRRYLREHRIDTLIAVETTLALYAIPAAFGLGVRVIAWEHFNFGNDAGRRKRALARHVAARFGDAVVTLTERDKAMWIERTTRRARIHVIPNPLARHATAPYAGAACRTVLAVGRLDPVKGFDLLLQAWQTVMQDDDARAWKLLIVGDGPERDRLDHDIQRLGLAGSVTLEPATRDIDRYYARATIVCGSSRHEGLPMVLIEANDHGIPIVAFDCETGPAEIVDHGGSGLLVPPQDVDALARALLRLMLDEPLRRRMSARARGLATRFSAEAIGEQWRHLLLHRTSPGSAERSDQARRQQDAS